MPLGWNKFNRRLRGTAMLFSRKWPAGRPAWPPFATTALAREAKDASNRARARLDPRRDFTKECPAHRPRKGPDVTIPADERPRTRADLAWSISVGGIGIVLFTAMLVFTWYF